MSSEERIAIALERIADVLEKQNAGAVMIDGRSAGAMVLQATLATAEQFLKENKRQDQQ